MKPHPLHPSSLILHPYSLYAPGERPIWTQNVGRGLVLNVGVAPGFFSASERSAGLLRALTRFAHQRAGGTYREPGFLRLKRGRYTIVHTFSEPLTVEGRMVDVLSPTLNTADDRVIAPDSSALLYDLGSPDAEAAYWIRIGKSAGARGNLSNNQFLCSGRGRHGGHGAAAQRRAPHDRGAGHGLAGATCPRTGAGGRRNPAAALPQRPGRRNSSHRVAIDLA